MSSYAITAEVRSKKEKPSFLRCNKKVPAVVYGKKQDPISISLDASNILRLYRNAWKSNIVNMTVWKKSIEVLIHDVQFDPVIGSIHHVDFYAIVRWEALHAEINLNFTWEAGAKKEWAIIEEVLNKIKVKCRPRHLVNHFDVDLWLLKEPWDVIRICDIWIDTSIYEIESHNNDDVVVIATLPRAAVASSDDDNNEEEEKNEEEAPQ